VWGEEEYLEVARQVEGKPPAKRGDKPLTKKGHFLKEEKKGKRRGFL